MTAPADFTQRAREALVEVLDTLDTIVALTGRGSDNVVAAEDLTAAELPRIGYGIGRVQQLTATDFRVPVTFTAAATDAATANALLNAIDEGVSNLALAATTNPIDSYRERADEGHQDAARDDSADCYVASIDVVLVASAATTTIASVDVAISLLPELANDPDAVATAEVT